MAELWLYADPHYGHDAIRRHCYRPFASLKDMDEALLSRYNDMVKPRDKVIFLGDFAFKDHAKYLAKLPGHKVFVFGNHDRMSMDALRSFSDVIGARHCPGVIEMHIGAYHVTGSHFPMLSWNASHFGSWHVHGHCHGRMPEPDDVLRCDVGVDIWDFYPVNFELVRRKLEARLPAWRARQAALSERYRDEKPGDDIRPNRSQAIPLLTAWLAEREQNALDTTDFNLRYAAGYTRQGSGADRNKAGEDNAGSGSKLQRPRDGHTRGRKPADPSERGLRHGGNAQGDAQAPQ